MDTGTKTYQIDKHKQLIPLNGSMVNFSCMFEVKSKDNKPFNITIVEQGEIKPKQYKLVENGYINGQLESDGQLKSYFLVLKAQQPCECDVRIIVKPKEQGEKPPPPIPPQPSQPESNKSPSTTMPQQTQMMVQTTGESYFQMKYIVGLSVTLIIVYLLYKYRKTIFEKFSTKERLFPSVSTTSF